MAEPRLEYFAGMGDHRAHLCALDRIDALAYDVAQRLGSAVVGPPHLLLAILDERADDSRAAQALGDCGVTSEAAEALARDYARDDRDEAHTPQTNPAFQNLQNMAEGMAAGLRGAGVRGEPALPPFLGDPNFPAPALSRLETSREQVRDRLAELGVRLPQSGLP